MTQSDAEEKQAKESASVLNLFVEHLGVDEELAQVLIAEGFSSLEEVAYVPLQEMLEVEGFDEDLVEELRNRAKDALLNRALVKEENLAKSEPAEDLLGMDGMDTHLAWVLASKGICTMEDLAEQGTDDLVGIEGLTEQKAAQLIMTARAPWFANE